MTPLTAVHLVGHSQRLASPRKADWEHLIKFFMREVDPRWQEAAANANGKQSLEVCVLQGFCHLASEQFTLCPAGDESTEPEFTASTNGGVVARGVLSALGALAAVIWHAGLRLAFFD